MNSISIYCQAIIRINGISDSVIMILFLIDVEKRNQVTIKINLIVNKFNS